MSGVDMAGAALAIFPLIISSMMTAKTMSLSAASSHRFAHEIQNLEHQLRFEQFHFQQILGIFLDEDLTESSIELETFSDMINEDTIKSVLDDRKYIVFLELVAQLHELLGECQRIWNKINGVSSKWYRPIYASSVMDFRRHLYSISVANEHLGRIVLGSGSGSSERLVQKTYRQFRNVVRNIDVCPLLDTLENAQKDGAVDLGWLLVQQVHISRLLQVQKCRRIALPTKDSLLDPYAEQTPLLVTRSFGIPNIDYAATKSTELPGNSDLIAEQDLKGESAGQVKHRVQFEDLDAASHQNQSPSTAHSAHVDQPQQNISLSEFAHIIDPYMRSTTDGRRQSYSDATLIKFISIDKIIGQMPDTGHSILPTMTRVYLAYTSALAYMGFLYNPLDTLRLRAQQIYVIANSSKIDIKEIFIRLNIIPRQDSREEIDFATLAIRILDLGILLSEICLNKRIPVDASVTQNATFDTILGSIDHVKILESVRSEWGLSYSNVVNACFRHEILFERAGVTSLDRQVCFKQLYKTIISPLQDLIKVFGEGPIEATFVSEPLVDRPLGETLHETEWQFDLRIEKLSDLERLRLYADIILQACALNPLKLKEVYDEVKDIDLGLEAMLEQDNATRVSVLEDEATLLQLGKQILLIFDKLRDLLRDGPLGSSRKDLDLVVVELRLNAETLTKLIRHSAPLTVGVPQVPGRDPDASMPSLHEQLAAEKIQLDIDEGYVTDTAATSIMEPVWVDSDQLAENWLSSICGGDSLLPLLIQLPELGYGGHRRLQDILNSFCEDLKAKAQVEVGLTSHQQAAIMLHSKVPWMTDFLLANYAVKDADTEAPSPPNLVAEHERYPSDPPICTQVISSFVSDDTFAEKSSNAQNQPSILHLEPESNISISAGSPSLQKSNFSALQVMYTLVEDWLTSGEIFGRFRLALRAMLKQKPMEVIREEVILGNLTLETGSASIEIRLDCQFRQFMEMEIGNTRDPGQILVVSGGSYNVYADTCSRYLGYCWPKSDHDLVSLFLAACSGKEYESPDAALRGQQLVKDTDHDYRYLVSFVGTTDKIIELAQQLAWLTAVFRINDLNALGLSEAEFMSVDYGKFELRPGKLEKFVQRPGICWYPLLGHCLIASGFPIPDRDEIGLELPFQSLVHLSRVSAELHVNGCKSLYGSSSLLFPVTQRTITTEDGQARYCVQWHLLSGNLPFKSADIFMEDGSWPVFEDDFLLATSRTIIGYCRRARLNLGTEHYDYAKVTASGLQTAESKPGVKIKSITMGTSGMGVFGAQITADIVYPNSIEMCPAITKYDDILDTTRGMSMLLLDTKDRRAWLVPAQNALLHMAHCWLRNQKCQEPGAALGFADPEWIGSEGVEGLLVRDYKVKLKTRLDDDSDYYLRDLIKDFWQTVSGCLTAGKKLRTDERSALTLPSDRIRAWDLFDFVGANKPSMYFLRDQPLGHSGCGWEALARDPDLMVLACRDIGEVIQCVPQLNLCNSWRPIPPNLMYLTASISCMQPVRPHLKGDIARKLTETIFWTPPNESVLDECTHGHEAECRKQLQKLSTSKPPIRNSPATLPQSGAVIFGTNVLRRPLPAPADRPSGTRPNQERPSSKLRKLFARRARH